MSSSFPGGLDSFTTKVDNVNTVFAADVNNLQDAASNIEQTVRNIGSGASPGAFALTNAAVAGALGISSDGAGNIGTTSSRSLIFASGLTGGGFITMSSGVPSKPGNVNPVVGDINFRTGDATALETYVCSVGGATPTWIACPLLGSNSIDTNGVAAFGIGTVNATTITIGRSGQPVNFGGGQSLNGFGSISVPNGSSLDTTGSGSLSIGNTNATSTLLGRSGQSMGFYGHAGVAQPAAPVTLADVIAVIRGCGLSA